MALDDNRTIAVLVGGEASLAPAEVMVSAGGLAQVCFLLDREHGTAELRVVIQSLAPCAEADFADPQACLRAVRSLGADVVVTFTDVLCPLAAELNCLITGITDGLMWGRKDRQRAALHAAGVSAVRSAPASTSDALLRFVGEVGYPVVVKPVNGVASRDTWIVRTDADLTALLSTAASEPGYLGQMFAEQFISGTAPPSRQVGDYVSAELFRMRADGRGAQADTVEAFVTDRLVPAWPFRETGLMLPSQQAEGTQKAALGVASRALDAIEAGTGAFHVELKPRLPAPEIIEVNGRLGGFVARLARYGADADLGRLALACALGRAHESSALCWRRCVVVLLFQAPATAVSVTAAPSRREVARLAGVVAVDSVARRGPAPDWRAGTNQAMARVWIAADDHAALFSRLADIAGFLAERFAFADASGDTVTDWQWLEAVCDPN